MSIILTKQLNLRQNIRQLDLTGKLSKQIQQKNRPIILIIMPDLTFSILTLVFFSATATKLDTCYYTALIYNAVHIISHCIIVIPILFKALKFKSFSKIKKDYIKSFVTSKYRMPLFSAFILLLSLACLYTIIIELFLWTNYGYLFTVFCLICSSLTHVSTFIKLKLDCSLFFSLQTYKFFCLAIASILFGISAHETKLSAEILGMGWAFFVYRSKQSLPKQIIYYLILFMDVVILLTAIMVIGASQQTIPQIDVQHVTRRRFTLLFSVTFFGFLFSLEIYEFVQLYRNFGRTQGANKFKEQGSMVDFYSKFQRFKEKNRSKQQIKQDHHECSICLQNFMIENPQKGQKLILNCGHYFHSQCLEQWALINHTCPMCRKHMISGVQEQISI